MRALVISGGGSKGAFAGGVAQYLMDDMKYEYDIFIGTSTGSLLISHLALGKVDEIRRIYTSVNQNSIFSTCPFIIKTDKQGNKQIEINHVNVLKSFLKGKKTFGESLNLRQLIRNALSVEDFESLKASSKDIVVTVSNLSLNRVEYKSIKNFDYQEFCDWVWISANFTPFMSLVEKNGCEYADGGFGSMVPIDEAISRGANEIDVIVLQTEVSIGNHHQSKNVFSLMTNIFSFMSNRIEKQNIHIGKLITIYNHAILNFYYTPTVLTNNALVFDAKLMAEWWQKGYEYAKKKNKGCDFAVYNEL
ncbi:MAG: patatin-like phospholipase family protein [Chitinophagales bacterium]|nr:patatin-like phospholipase family protein [Chitinophagales bacterium]MCZ2393193.1 patatin-like phospholipase family protein [Chitinophagales bacterium]